MLYGTIIRASTETSVRAHYLAPLPADLPDFLLPRRSGFRCGSVSCFSEVPKVDPRYTVYEDRRMYSPTWTVLSKPGLGRRKGGRRGNEPWWAHYALACLHVNRESVASFQPRNQVACDTTFTGNCPGLILTLDLVVRQGNWRPRVSLACIRGGQ